MNLTYLEVDHNRAGYDSLTGEARSAFMERLVLSWMYHDHALEGVVLSHADMKRALSGQPVRNYCDGLVQKSLTRMQSIAAHLFECAQRNDEITMEFIKDLHVRLCDDSDEAGGRYRKRDTSPGVYNLNIVPNGSISYYFRKFLELCNEDLKDAHPIRAAAIAHHEFMKLFPFDEKSGIVGRLVMSYMLIRAGYPPAIIHQMDRHHYFSALDGHQTDLVPVLVDALSATLEAADEFARQLPPAKPEVAYAE